MDVKTARFLTGAVGTGGFPPPLLPEVAFSGKSNVGKSSLLNKMLNRKNLVKTSSTPGKTKEINFFLINETFRMVDLPGYGFSRVSKAQQGAWKHLMEAYLTQRPNLKGVVLIVDVRHPASPLDLSMKEWLEATGLPHVLVANKTDKLSRSQRKPQLEELKRGFSLETPPLPFSALTGEGVGELWKVMEGWLSGAARH
ncbi:MAG: ribosome biogenesis GTP-binding protein YihA/YsxC [Deltaproteobacteria bacterium]|nr:ribosome biogenesis GTP-binding protein YihA/YsxC [Deltaproteobacteria bacterium]